MPTKKSPTGLRMNQRRGGFCCAYYSKFLSPLATSFPTCYPYFKASSSYACLQCMAASFLLWTLLFHLLFFCFHSTIISGKAHPIALPILELALVLSPKIARALSYQAEYCHTGESLRGVLTDSRGVINPTPRYLAPKLGAKA